MGWDSNPRYPCGHAGFQDRCLKPLGHPSNFSVLNGPPTGGSLEKACRSLLLANAGTLATWPVHDWNTAYAVFWAALDDAVAIGHIDEHIALAVEEADYLQFLEEEAAPLVKNTLAVLELGDDLDRPDLAACDTGVARVFSDPQPALHPSCLRPAEVAGNALDFGIVEAVNDDFVVRSKQPELGADRARRAALRPAENPPSEENDDQQDNSSGDYPKSTHATLTLMLDRRSISRFQVKHSHGFDFDVM